MLRPDFDASSDDLEQRFVAERTRLIATHQESVLLQLQLVGACVLIGILQRAYRDTSLPDEARMLVTTLADQLAEAFAPDSAIAEVIRRGWNAARDG